MNRFAVVLGIALVLPALARAEDLNIPQLSPLGRAAAAGGPPQIQPQARPAAGVDQVSSALLSGGSMQQVAPFGRSSEAPESLSTIREGRRLKQERIAGVDRCANADAKDCENIIERRAAAFANPPPPDISPEARLLLNLPPATDLIGALRSDLLKSGRVDDYLAAEAISAAAAQSVAPAPEPDLAGVSARAGR